MIQRSIIKNLSFQINNKNQCSAKAYQKKEILEKYKLLKAENCKEEVIFKILKISRSTLFLWKKKYKKTRIIRYRRQI